MKRILMSVLVLAAVLGSAVVGSTIAWSNNAPAANAQASTIVVDFDQTFAEVTSATRGGSAPAVVTAVDFNQAFADATVRPDRVNTPANREKLRDSGWARITGSR
jgi:hypothetical protein